MSVVENMIMAACFGGKEIFIETCQISDIRRIAEYALERHDKGELRENIPSFHESFYEDMRGVLKDWAECGDISAVALKLLMTAIETTFLDWRP